MIPAVALGILFEEEMKTLFGGQILLVGLMLVATGTLLFLADKAKNTLKDVSTSNALVIGIAQAIAILPVYRDQEELSPRLFFSELTDKRLLDSPF